jgi:hypothetical protein
MPNAQRESTKSPGQHASDRGKFQSTEAIQKMHFFQLGSAQIWRRRAYCSGARHREHRQIAGVDTRSLQAYLGHSNIQNPTRYTVWKSRNAASGLSSKGQRNFAKFARIYRNLRSRRQIDVWAKRENALP